MANGFFKENKALMAMITLLWLMALAFVIYQPNGEALPAILTKTYWIFGLAGTAAALTIGIGGMLLYRWNLGGRKNETTLIWGVSFLLFSITFIGMCLKAIGVPWANDSDPKIFFLFRHWMILWTAGMSYGITGILFSKQFWRTVNVLVILIASYAWFTYGLLMVGNIELTMFGFLYAIFIPVCVTVAYCFYKYGSMTGFKSLKVIAFGFAQLAVAYMAWAPWHKVDTYILWFFFFVWSLIPILVGFCMLMYEKQISQPKKGRKTEKPTKV